MQNNNIHDVKYIANRPVGVTFSEQHFLCAFDSLFSAYITLIKISTEYSQMYETDISICRSRYYFEVTVRSLTKISGEMAQWLRALPASLQDL